jgi:hypothetical protein
MDSPGTSVVSGQLTAALSSVTPTFVNVSRPEFVTRYEYIIVCPTDEKDVGLAVFKREMSGPET